MERMCDICQSVTYDDEESICSVCGAELSPAEDTEVEEVQEETVDQQSTCKRLDTVAPVPTAPFGTFAGGSGSWSATATDHQ